MEQTWCSSLDDAAKLRILFGMAKRQRKKVAFGGVEAWVEAEDLMADAPLILQHLVRADSSAVFAEHNQIGAARLSFEGER